MHNTSIVLKENNEKRELTGKSFLAPIERIRFDSEIFEHSYIKLFDIEPFYLCDIASAITADDRISINTLGNRDEIAEMKKWWGRYKSGEVKFADSDFVEPNLRYSDRHPCGINL